MNCCKTQLLIISGVFLVTQIQYKDFAVMVLYHTTAVLIKGTALLSTLITHYQLVGQLMLNAG